VPGYDHAVPPGQIHSPRRALIKLALMQGSPWVSFPIGFTLKGRLDELCARSADDAALAMRPGSEQRDEMLRSL
jgi:hypothetical protein